MKKIIKIPISIIFFSTISFANEYAVITNKKMRELSPAQIKAVFLKKINVIDDVKVIPLNLGARNPLRLNFENRVLKMSFPRLKSYWIKHHYSGQRPPISMKSEASVIAFVKRVEGAIGYVNTNNLDKDVKTIYRWSE